MLHWASSVVAVPHMTCQLLLTGAVLEHMMVVLRIEQQQ